MSVITRFPPSPTGFMHIGTARTALFNWLYTKHTGGKMLFRIEDTDRERYTPEAVQAIINGLKWLELDYDGDVVSQYERRHRHAEIAHELVKKGQAYFCYCTPEELDDMRAKAVAEGRPQFYDRRWRNKTESDAPVDRKPVIRIKAPLEGSRTVADKVQGDVTVAAENLDDFIILRSDGVPTYMLAVVVDDHDMGVTHVIRGDDHLNNTFRQNLIYEAMGWNIPIYAHLPLILGPDGAKLSKRHGATSVEEYRDMGYLPEAMRNYLLRLGWSHGDEDIMPQDRMIELFDLDGIGKSPSRFDFDKLNFINAHYLKLADDDRLVNLCADLYAKQNIELNAAQKSILKAVMYELKSRVKTLVELIEEAKFLIIAPNSESFEEKAKAQLDSDGVGALQIIAESFAEMPNFIAPEIESKLKELATTHRDGKLGKIMMPYRAAITGKSTSPAMPICSEILGKDEILKRLQLAIAHFSV
jgi:glutamyl-tRNA synthetase